MSDPKDWFEGRPRVMFVHAHPDDETITTGGTLAALAEAGMEPLLVTLTRGERGEVVAGPFEALVAAHGLAVVRQNELRTALSMLGAVIPAAPGSEPAGAAESDAGASDAAAGDRVGIRHAFLGVAPARAKGLAPTIYEDSGMAWASDGRATAGPDAGPDALTSVPAIEPLNDLLAAAYLAGAQGIVSYDDGGGYGHPDHVLAHRLSRAVASALGLPFWEVCRDHGAPYSPDETLETDDQLEKHDITPWFERKVAALRGHATQLTVDGDDLVHVGGQREPIGRIEAFRRLT